MSAPCLDLSEQLWAELWVSLASLLRSYTAVHGLQSGAQATVAFDAGRILTRRGEKWLDLEREGPSVRWRREDGTAGNLELMETGRLSGAEFGPGGEEEMDLAAEMWARELMR